MLIPILKKRYYYSWNMLLKRKCKRKCISGSIIYGVCYWKGYISVVQIFMEYVIEKKKKKKNMLFKIIFYWSWCFK